MGSAKRDYTIDLKDQSSAMHNYLEYRYQHKQDPLHQALSLAFAHDITGNEGKRSQGFPFCFVPGLMPGARAGLLQHLNQGY